MLAVAGITGDARSAHTCAWELQTRTSLLRVLYVPEAQGSLDRRRRHYTVRTRYTRRVSGVPYVYLVVEVYRVPCAVHPGYTLLKLDNNTPLCSEVGVGRRVGRANRTSDNESEGTPLTAS